jgi:hypothetical protein
VNFFARMPGRGHCRIARRDDHPFTAAIHNFQSDRFLSIAITRWRRLERDDDAVANVDAVVDGS